MRAGVEGAISKPTRPWKVVLRLLLKISQLSRCLFPSKATAIRNSVLGPGVGPQSFQGLI